MSDFKIHQKLITTRDWTKYEDFLCAKCEATCCYMPVEADVNDLVKLGILSEFHLELDELEQKKDALKHKDIIRYNSKNSMYTLKQQASGACIYLDLKKKNCTVYEDRPKTCRNHPQVGPKPGYCGFLKKK